MERLALQDRAVAAVLGGLCALAFPEAGLIALAPLGLAAITGLTASASTMRDALLVAWSAGVGYFAVAGHWLLPKVGPGLIVFAALLALTWIPFGAVVRWGVRSSPMKLVLVLGLAPAAFVAGEYLRSWEHLGGPWGLLGASLWNSPRLLAPAALAGIWLVDGLMVLVAVGLVSAARPTASARGRIVGVLAVAAAAWLWLASPALLEAPAPADTVSVAGVQPGPDLDRDARLSASLAATKSLATRSPDLVVWGESSVGFALSDPGIVDALAAAAREAGAPVVANVDARRGTGGIFKSAVLIDGSGAVDRYDKMRLVPFGEYIPLRPILGWVGSLSDAAEEDRERGTVLAPLTANDLTFGALVCFESTFPDMARTLARRGAELIVVQSSTETFQDGWAPEQHASLAAVRAVETGRSVVHATLTGVSAAFDPAGRSLVWVPTAHAGTYVVEVPLARGLTPYVRYGDWLPRLFVLTTAAWVVLQIVRTRRSSRPRRSRPGRSSPSPR